MARRGQTVNVKVPRKKVIAALEKSLKKLEDDYKNQDKLQKEYSVKYDKWLKLVYSKVKSSKPTFIDVTYGGTNIRVGFEMPKSLPKEPQKDWNTLSDWQYKDGKEEINNAIRLLNMCEDEYISTATYGSITKYL